MLILDLIIGFKIYLIKILAKDNKSLLLIV